MRLNHTVSPCMNKTPEPMRATAAERLDCRVAGVADNAAAAANQEPALRDVGVAS